MEVARNFRIGDSTIVRIISETCEAIWTVLVEKVMPTPDKEKFLEVAAGFENRWNFPNVIGAIDGKHVNIQSPPNSGSTHRNYKHQHSTVLLAVCDYRYRFLMVDIGAEGRRSDGGIFAASVFGKAFENNTLDIPMPDAEGCPYYMVGDAAFPLSLYLLKPYPGNLFDDERKSTYNYRLSRARRTIENTFGILAAKWRIYRSPIQASLSTTHKIIKATVCLHNYVLMSEEMEPRKRYCPKNFVDREIGGRVIQGDWRKIIEEDGSCFKNITAPLGSNFSSKKARDLRDYVADIFLTPHGSVPWQKKAIQKHTFFYN